MAGSLVAGLVAAALLVAAPFVPAEVNAVLGAVLCGFALGWAMVGLLSARFTDQPQRWAFAPAVFMGFGGVLLLAFGSAVSGALSWVWPPALLLLAFWVIVRIRQNLHSRTGRALLYPVLAVLAVASLGGGYEAVSAATETERSMPGQLIDVGGHRLHLSCTGSGSPTVVLEPGAGGIASGLELVAPAVARDTRVCVYDRAGRGWSDPADTTQDANQIARNLNTLLRRAGVPGPYVLAGHSFGGLYALTFAAHYPEQVAGMVLVDTTAPAMTAAPEDAGSSALRSRISALLTTSARLGLGRLLGADENHLRSTIDEYLLANVLAGQAAALTDFGDKPLVVLTAGEGSGAAGITRHEELAGLSTNSVHRVVDGASHSSLIMEERDAAATVQGVLDTVSSVRTGQPLAR